MIKLLILALALCGCYLKQFPLTPEIANESTYMLYDANGAQGTAWAVADHYLITAGHMCNSADNSFSVIGTKRRFHATAVVWEYIMDGTRDICLLHTDAPLPSHLIIASKMPAVGDKVSYVGYPLGVYEEHSGVYLGDMDCDKNHYNDYTYTAPSDHGASGSALYDADGVWGVLVRIRTDEPNCLEPYRSHESKDGGVATPLADIKALLDDAGVNYDTTPQMPEGF